MTDEQWKFTDENGITHDVECKCKHCVEIVEPYFKKLEEESK